MVLVTSIIIIGWLRSFFQTRDFAAYSIETHAGDDPGLGDDGH